MFIKQCDKVHKSTQERSTPLRWIQNILNASYDFFLRKNKNYKNKHERLFQLKHNCANNPKRKKQNTKCYAYGQQNITLEAIAQTNINAIF